LLFSLPDTGRAASRPDWLEEKAMTDRRLYRLLDEVAWALTVTDRPLRWGADPVLGAPVDLGDPEEYAVAAAAEAPPDPWLAALAGLPSLTLRTAA
jgi:hypothetical protein